MEVRGMENKEEKIRKVKKNGRKGEGRRKHKYVLMNEEGGTEKEKGKSDEW